MKEKLWVRYVFLVFLIFLTMFVLIFFPVYLVNELDKQTNELLNEISRKNSESVGFILREQNVFLENMAIDIDPACYLDPKAAVESIDSFNVELAYERYGVILPNSIAYTSNQEFISVSEMSFMRDCFEENRVVLSRVDAEKSPSGEDIFVIAKPLVKDGVPVSAVYIVFSTEDLLKNFGSASFNNRESYFLIDQNGGVMAVIGEHHDFDDITNIFNSRLFADNYQAESKREMKSNMQNGESGTVYLDLKDGDLFIYYSPLHYKGIYLASVVPAAEVNNARNRALNYVILMCLFLVLTFGLFALYIMLNERLRVKSFNNFLYTDPLTGNPSYAKFCVEVEKALKKNRGNCAYISMDLDEFKLVNTAFDYEQGNETIKFISNLWISMLREGEYVGRINGDRFNVFLRYESRQELYERLDRFCDRCRMPEDGAMANYSLSPSMGIYYIPSGETDLQSIHDCAVFAKTVIKGDHEQHYAVYNDRLKEELTRDKKLEDDLRKALANGELSLYFQPQFTAEDRKFFGAEALLRWKKPDGSFVPPELFISIAERCGLIKELDRYVFRKACTAQNALADMSNRRVNISVNVSQQSLYNPLFVNNYLDIVKETGADISCIELEITETALFDNNRRFISLLNRLHKANFKILMDDFGTGYSSLMLLKNLPIDYLKLDKSFIDDYDNIKGRNIIECVINMGKQLGIVLIAEGVETAEQREFLVEMGCDIIQGYYFSRPLSFEELMKKLEGYDISTNS